MVPEQKNQDLYSYDHFQEGEYIYTQGHQLEYRKKSYKNRSVEHCVILE